MLNIEEIKELLRAVESSSLQKVSIKDGEFSLTAEKGCPTAAVISAAAGPAAENKPAISVPKDNFLEIKAPMVGTFYSAAEPEAEPFVKVGTMVGPETVVCVLEAMKIFTEVQAECSGEVVEVLVKNGDFVEYDQPLFRVKV